MTGKRYETAAIADMEDSKGWAPIRKRFGVESFGINAWTAHEDGGSVIPEHDEMPSSHEELYLVVSGHATFTVDGEEIDAPQGTVLFVRDPAAKRGANAREAGTTVLAVGAKPGEAYRPRSWELNADIPGMFDRGEHEKAKKRLTEALPKYEDKAGMLYNIACAEALLGETDEALGHLGESLEAHPAYAEMAREDPDFESIRSDPRFAELVGGASG
jgi:quercetin dioxygenase-like cupin family protein